MSEACVKGTRISADFIMCIYPLLSSRAVIARHEAIFVRILLLTHP